MTIIVSISGGKDSTATLLKALEKYSNKDIIGVFCDTGWEHPATYEYINMLKDKTKVKIHTVRNEKYMGLLDLIEHKRIFPCSLKRFCSSNLKVKPMIDFLCEYVENNPNAKIENWVGIRADESLNRKKKYGGLSPAETFVYSDIYKLTKKQTKILHNVRLRYPIIDLSANAVYKLIIKAGLEINPLYYQGSSRVGCYPCLIGGLKGFKSVWKDDIGKERILKLQAIEEKLQKAGSKAQLKPNISAKELVRLLENNDNQLSLFDCENEYVCGFCNI